MNGENDFAQASGARCRRAPRTSARRRCETANSQLQRASKTLGLFVQEQASIRDRFVPHGRGSHGPEQRVRHQVPARVLSEAHLSYIISDESFFPKFDWLNQFRLRSAYGARACSQDRRPRSSLPGLDGEHRHDADGCHGHGSPELLANALGNPGLKPSGRSEWENGFEMRLFDNRVNIDMNYYARKTRDALINQPIAPSAGPSNLTFTRNIGSIENSGIEGTLTTTILDRRQFGWDLTINASHNSNKIASLGVDDKGNNLPTIGTGTTRDSLGLPINAWFYHPYAFSDANNDGIIVASEVQVQSGFVYFGYSSPRDIVGVQNGFDLFSRKLRINTLRDYKAGFGLFNSTTNFYCGQTNQCFDETHKSASLAAQARLVATRYGSPTTAVGYLENGQFWRLREVSGTLTLPMRAASSIRAKDASFTFAARNLHVWTKYTGTDPEANYSTGDANDSDHVSPNTSLRLNLHY